ATLSDKLWDGRAEWVVGSDYLRARSAAYTAQMTTYGPFIDPYNFDPALYPNPPATDIRPLPLATGDTVRTQIGGVFASLRIELTEPWSVTAGLRRSSEHVTDEIVYYWSGKGFPAFSEIEHRNVITPYAGTVFRLGSTWSLYASYADIFLNNS